MSRAAAREKSEKGSIVNEVDGGAGEARGSGRRERKERERRAGEVILSRAPGGSPDLVGQRLARLLCASTRILGERVIWKESREQGGANSFNCASSASDRARTSAWSVGTRRQSAFAAMAGRKGARAVTLEEKEETQLSNAMSRCGVMSRRTVASQGSSGERAVRTKVQRRWSSSTESRTEGRTQDRSDVREKLMRGRRQAKAAEANASSFRWSVGHTAMS